MSEATPSARDEERRSLRPYRRFVQLLFTLAIMGLCAVILRGIVRTLDRLPSVETLDRLELVDERALRACAEDLDKLEARVRLAAGDALAAAPGGPANVERWRATTEAIEVDRLRIVARCRLEEGSDDPVVRDLRLAGQSIESLIRSYHFLFARHQAEGVPESQSAREAVKRARDALESRK